MRNHTKLTMMVWREKAVERCGKITMPALSRRHQALSFFHQVEWAQRISFTAKN